MAVRPSRDAEFDGAGTLHLPGKTGVVNRWLVHVQGTGWTGSVTPKGKVSSDDSLTAIEVSWYNMVTGAVVAAGSAPTDDALMLIDSTGMDIELTVAASAGSVKIVADPVVG